LRFSSKDEDLPILHSVIFQAQRTSCLAKGTKVNRVSKTKGSRHSGGLKRMSSHSPPPASTRTSQTPLFVDATHSKVDLGALCMLALKKANGAIDGSNSTYSALIAAAILERGQQTDGQRGILGAPVFAR
jgi:hypothetical protein